MTRASYYRDLGEGWFESTTHAEGAWDPSDQHMAAACGLLTRELEIHAKAADAASQASGKPGANKRFARLSFDILGRIHAGKFRIEVQTLRPGRTIELLQATMIHTDRAILSVRAWRLATGDASDVAGVADPPIPQPFECDPYPEMSRWPGGYMRQTTYRVSARSTAGAGVVWMHTDMDVVEGERPSALVRAMSMADTTNGVMPRGDKDQWLYPNVDFTVHLYRLPQPGWLGFDVRQSIGTDAIGVTSTVLHDSRGAFGRAEQILTVRKAPQ